MANGDSFGADGGDSLGAVASGSQLPERGFSSLSGLP